MQTVSALPQRAGYHGEHPFLRRLLQARRLPMLYAVTIVAGIFYHYAPLWTPFWILASVLIQAGLFAMFDYIKRHQAIGTVIYLAAGLAVFLVSDWLIGMGRSSPVFAPEDPETQIPFYIWFLTPQSVLVTSYLGYTAALFLLFSFFIGSVTYYFTYVRYRVLMSFVIMLFPFAIYAKENEDMPVPCIILLFACYFAVMIYCRQARSEDLAVSVPMDPQGGEFLTMPSRKSPYYGQKPELLDGRFLRAGGLFLAVSCIAVLLVPKPRVSANRRYLDTMLDLTSFSDYLMSAISGFNDSSDGGNYSELPFTRALYYATAAEPLNLRVRTMTNYHYDTDSWTASSYDMQPQRKDPAFRHSDGFEKVSADPDPEELLTALYEVLHAEPALAQKWGLTAFAAQRPDLSGFRAELTVEAATAGYNVLPLPHNILSVRDDSPVFQNLSGICFRYTNQRQYRDLFSASYLSPKISESLPVRQITAPLNAENWTDFLTEALTAADGKNETAAYVLIMALQGYADTLNYVDSVQSQTPDSVRSLAGQLTEGLTSDYEKAVRICNYLKYGEFTYSLDFQKTMADNTETFLFQNKTGVCYQFAGAMVELCRAAGLPTRYVEGYSMSEPNTQLNSSRNYLITTKHGHAFAEVYIAGFGWMSFDPTAGSITESLAEANPGVISALQKSGLILLAAALLLVILFIWILPALREQRFRRKYRRARDAGAVQAAFERLRGQWKEDPSLTVRMLCDEMGPFLHTDLTELAEGVEQTLYAERCTPELADRIYVLYCKAYDAWKPAVRQQKKAERLRQRAERAAKRARSAQPVSGETG